MENKRESVKPRLNVGIEFLAIRRLAEVMGLSMAACFLYEALLWENNIRYWVEYFMVDDFFLAQKSRIPRTKLAPIKRELAAAGLLQMQKGKANRVVYRLCSASHVLEELKHRAKENEASFFWGDAVNDIDFLDAIRQQRQQMVSDNVSEGAEFTGAQPKPKAERTEPRRQSKQTDTKEKPRGYRPGTTARGEYHNVFLTDEELQKLRALHPQIIDALLAHFSQMLKEKGYGYADHFEALLHWAKDFKPRDKAVFASSADRAYTEEDILAIKRREYELNRRLFETKP